MCMGTDVDITNILWLLAKSIGFYNGQSVQMTNMED